MALRADGTVVAWGNSDCYGELDVPFGLSHIVAISAGANSNLALKSDGTVVAWGSGGYVPTGLSNVVSVAAGDACFLALISDGTVVGWGGNYYGQTNIPAGLSNVVAVAAGAGHCLALKADGTVVGWGYDRYGQASPPAGLSNVVAIDAQGYGSEALKADGTVVVWGDLPQAPSFLTNVVAISGMLALVPDGPIQIAQNPQSQVAFQRSNVTFSVTATGTGPLNYQWFLDGQALTNGSRVNGATTATLSISTLQIADMGIYTVVVSNAFGAVRSDGATLTEIGPPYILTQPSSAWAPPGGSAAFAVSSGGSSPLAYQWRFNGKDIPDATNAILTLANVTYRQMGYYDVTVSNSFGTVVSEKVFLTVSQTSVLVWNGGLYRGGEPTNVPPGMTNVVAVAAGNFDVLALKRDGTVVTWSGLRGPSVVTNAPANVTNVVAIATGSYGAGTSDMALKADGTVVVWGDNPFFGLTNVPSAATNVIGIADGGDHCLAVRSDGMVVGWGVDNWGQATPPVGLTNIVAVAAGNQFSFALRDDGTVVAWGNGPTPPSGLTNVVAISASTPAEGMALKADGTVVSWGALPWEWQIPGNTSNYVAVSLGAGTFGLRADGSVVSSPVNFPSSVSNVIAIAAGGTIFSVAPGFVVTVLADGSPFITLPPLSRTVTSGATVHFHARAVGVQPLNDQWQFNGANIAGATNGDLTLANVHSANVGDYQIIVTNFLGAVTSRVAHLTIPYSRDLATALNATNLAWTTGGNVPWFAENVVTHDGITAAQSGHISDGQESILQTTVTGPGTVTFWWKVSSEEYFDFLSFFLDNSNAVAISGEVDWQQRSFAIPSGTHTLKWIYAKDPSVSAGQDAGWLDQVTYTPDSPLVLSAPRLMLGGGFRFAAGAPRGTALQSNSLVGLEVQASTNLVDWAAMPDALTLTNGVLQIHDLSATNAPMRFYRIIENKN
ncbi:MAG TPA: immunoglobulin domain-containing protein [Verrucomicrobiae bacterium]|nr:immunoglobulin domain-containing protein [Verrucomicrobiae bacterium]